MSLPHAQVGPATRQAGCFAARVERWTRQSHRWLSLVFTATVLLNFAARALQPGEPPLWITYSPLPPLFLQLFSGLYLFALPYLRPRGGAGR
jgi:hypothetical protein